MTPVSAGLLLIGASALGLGLANSPLAETWQTALDWPILGHGIAHWVNDALMTLFFLLVGCEIKRELVKGQLKSAGDRWLPGFAALGGMVVPALIYLAFNLHDSGHPMGWAVPASTDIAFALGVLALLGKRVPLAATVLLTTIAVLDDMAAVLIIALVYSGGLNMLGLVGMAAVMAGLIGLNRAGVRAIGPYLGLGLLLWLATEYTGVHATLAGVLLAATLPIDAAGRVEKALHPLCAALIVPLFGLVNAGVSLTGMAPAALLHPVSLGIAAGLLVGKQLGVVLGCIAAVKLGLARLPEGLDWPRIVALGQFCGIGFTMSLFVGLLAFGDSADLITAMKIGVLAGSLGSALIGAAMFMRGGQRQTST